MACLDPLLLVARQRAIDRARDRSARQRRMGVAHRAASARRSRRCRSPGAASRRPAAARPSRATTSSRTRRRWWCRTFGHGSGKKMRMPVDDRSGTGRGSAVRRRARVARWRGRAPRSRQGAGDAGRVHVDADHVELRLGDCHCRAGNRRTPKPMSSTTSAARPKHGIEVDVGPSSASVNTGASRSNSSARRGVSDRRRGLNVRTGGRLPVAVISATRPAAC